MPTNLANNHANRAGHWNSVYDTKGPDRVSWFQPEPTVSLQLVEQFQLAGDDPIVDVGGGASMLVDRLLGRGQTDLTVLDVSAHALDVARHRLGTPANQVHWETTDVLSWTPPRHYGLWHDRAVFHFLTDPADRDRYRRRAGTSIRPGGHLIVATFAADGPRQCSGLPVARYTPDELAAEFGDTFIPIATHREHHRTPDGTDQPFTWLLARRDPDT